MYATDNTTFIDGFGLALALAMCLLMLILPRRQALLPVVALICFMTMGQRVMVLGLNFTMIRLLLAFGVARVLARGEWRLGPLNPVDRAMAWWVLASVVTYTLLWQTGEAFVNRLGFAYDALGLFFLLRMLVRTREDMLVAVRQFAWLAMPLAASMLMEKHTGRNPFAAFGGVPPETILLEGVLRCQGPFAHPILAGAFGSALIPAFLGLRVQGGGDALLAVLGLAAAAVICWAAGSSGPLMAAAAGVLGWTMYGLRTHMRLVRRGLAAFTLLLHLCMQAPVWFILARVSIFDGSTGYHRAILIDRAVHHFFEWALIGTYSTASWGYYMFDVTNQYVLIAVQGGLVSLVLFIVVISRSFASAGIAVREWSAGDPRASRFAWGLGCALLVHAVNYISVPYFDQNIVCWYLLLAMLSTARGLPRDAPAAATVAIPRPGRVATRPRHQHAPAHGAPTRTTP